MSFKLGIIFSIIVILVIIFSSVYLLTKYMQFMINKQDYYNSQKNSIVIEKHINNNFQKNSRREIIIDVNAQEIEVLSDTKYLLGSNNVD